MDAFGDDTRARFRFSALAAAIALCGAGTDVGDGALRLACSAIAVCLGGYVLRRVRMERIGRRYVADIDAGLARWDAAASAMDLDGRRRLARHRNHVRRAAIAEARAAAAANVLAYEVPHLPCLERLALPVDLAPAMPLKPLPLRKVKLRVGAGTIRPARGFTS